MLFTLKSPLLVVPNFIGKKKNRLRETAQWVKCLLGKQAGICELGFPKSAEKPGVIEVHICNSSMWLPGRAETCGCQGLAGQSV